jgi:hypothetical protein
MSWMIWVSLIVTGGLQPGTAPPRTHRSIAVMISASSIFWFLGLLSRANGRHAAVPATLTVTDLVLPEGCAVTVTV